MPRKRQDQETVPLTEAARRLGMGYDSLRDKLRYCCLHGITFPLGFAIPPTRPNENWDYIIPRQRFEAYMSGQDLNLSPKLAEGFFTIFFAKLEALFNQLLQAAFRANKKEDAA